MFFRKFLQFVCTGVLILASSSLFADELRWTHFGVRPLAMGNAYVAVADDFNALFYNPAGLARIKEWDGEFLNPTLEISATTTSFIKDLSKLAEGSTGDTDAVLDLLEKNTGKNHHFALGWTPHLIFPNWGFGVGANFDVSMVVHREISTDLKAGPEIIIPFTIAHNFFEDRLSVGYTLKAVAKGGVDREFSINDISAFTKKDNEDSNENKADPKLEVYVEGGYGIGTDVGILFTPIKTMEPTLGISITDLGGTPYEKADIGGEALGAPSLRLPSVNTGISLKPWQKNKMYLLTSMDAHAINQPVHYSKKLNLGLEWGYGTIIKVQSGLHQGELTGGFQFDVGLLNVRFVTYAEQLGTIAGQDDNLRDRRYALQLKLLL